MLPIRKLGEPIYTIVKTGNRGWFLAPYRVMRVNLDVDVDGYRPETGKLMLTDN
ncbi:hypothetical protein [Streptococcus pneumoniae]|uniref:hypothetical protein n=1 Tax=Streptococcus pneumoniae TaxID=1313 RepID=UPI0015F1A63D|nr:hypothetical protein [Streptococcus pneumoniae]